MFVPGLLYYVCGAVAILSILACLGLPETMNANLSDKISDARGKMTLQEK
jgi:hypothetical protein